MIDWTAVEVVPDPPRGFRACVWREGRVPMVVASITRRDWTRDEAVLWATMEAGYLLAATGARHYPSVEPFGSEFRD